MGKPKKKPEGSLPDRMEKENITLRVVKQGGKK